jgi:ferredoxin like protein
VVTDELFELVSYRINPEAHIRLNPDTCKGCTHQACTYSCPARCYTYSDERERVEFAYEACLECGTCLRGCR